MRRPLLALTAAALLATTACREERLVEGEGFDPQTPQFATDDHRDPALVNDGELTRIPPDVTITNLTIDGDRVPLGEAWCLSTGVPLEAGVTGFQATIPDRDGSVEARIDPATGTAEVDLTLDGEIVDVPEMRAEVVNDEVWYLEEPVEDTTEETPEVILVFGCPTPAEDNLETPEGEDPTDDPLVGAGSDS